MGTPAPPDPQLHPGDLGGIWGCCPPMLCWGTQSQHPRGTRCCAALPAGTGVPLFPPRAACGGCLGPGPSVWGCLVPGHPLPGGCSVPGCSVWGCSVPGCSVPGHSLPRGGAQYRDAHCPRGHSVPGCSVPGHPLHGGMLGTGTLGMGTPTAWGDTRSRDAWSRDARSRSAPLPGGCSVPGDARSRDAVPGGGRPGWGALLTAALEALPAAPPDEIPAEVAPGVEPAAPRLEAVPGARCRRQPGLGPRGGAVPPGRADAQRVGSLQAAPARPRLRLQLPQLDQLHGPGRRAAPRGKLRHGRGRSTPPPAPASGG